MNKENLKNSNYIYIFLSFLFIAMILPKILQMFFIIMLFVNYVLKYKKIYISYKVLPFLCFGIIHFFSIILNMHYVSDFERIIAAFNTCALWILGALLFSYIINEQINKEKISKIMFRNIVLIIIFSLLYYVMLRLNKGFDIPILKRIATFDWAYGYRSYRFTSFMEYPNLIPIFYFISLPFAYKYIENKLKIFKLLFLCISIFPIILCNSRLGIILSFLIIICLLPKILYNNNKGKIFVTSLFIIVSLFVFTFNYNNIFNKIDTLVNSRNDSTSMRTYIYKTSINEAINRNLILGCGIKTMINDYPLGSHSTFIGSFYKTGLVGSLVLIFGFIELLVLIYKMEKKSNFKIYLVSFTCLLIMLFLEDLDGSNWICILFFLIFGVYFNDKEEYNEKS